MQGQMSMHMTTTEELLWQELHVVRIITPSNIFSAKMLDVIDLLIEAGANINLADNYGATVLHRAAYTGYPGLVSYLIEHGADKTLKDNEGRLPIHCVRKECFEDLKDLLK